jgi:acetyltransferase-like isoleucine patch superfamily enzyme
MKVIPGRVVHRWRRFWASRAGITTFGRMAARLAAIQTPPYHGRAFLSGFCPQGFVSHTASIRHPRIKFGPRVYIGDNVVMWGPSDAGAIELNDGVEIYGDTFLHTSMGGRIVVDSGTHIQPGCHLNACLADLTIGKQVEIAPRCAFYSYDHSFAAGATIMGQPPQTKGPIRIGDGAWLGHAVIVLSGVHVGDGAVIGAGSVVTKDIPADAIAVGSPARVVGYRRSGSESAMRASADVS